MFLHPKLFEAAWEAKSLPEQWVKQEKNINVHLLRDGFQNWEPCMIKEASLPFRSNYFPKVANKLKQNRVRIQYIHIIKVSFSTRKARKVFHLKLKSWDFKPKLYSKQQVPQEVLWLQRHERYTLNFLLPSRKQSYVSVATNILTSKPTMQNM